MSVNASLAQCVQRKCCSVSTPCSWDSHPGLHPSDCGLGSSSKLCFKPGQHRYRSCTLVPPTCCRASLASEKYVSASPSHPGITWRLLCVSSVSLSCNSVNLALFHSGQQPESSTFGVFQCTYPSCTPCFRRHTPWIENHLPALSASQKRSEGRRICVFCQTVPKLRSAVCPEKLS